ncbi:MAG: restriction endonuclease subunit S [Betaproteobacteria bacterium]
MTLWAQKRLGDIAMIAWGDTTKTKAAYTDSGYIAFSASGPDGFMDHYDHEGPGVVLSAIGAQCGKTWFVQGKWSCIKNTIYLKAKPNEVDPRFLYYITANREIWPIRGAAQPFISQTDARAISIRVPPASTQRRIAAILAAYDDLIENNTRRIAILEEMARRIYEEWFVRFRFPGHEGVRMVESESGLVPEGWAITELGALLSVEKGLSYKGSGLTGVGVPMVNLKNILPGGGFRRDGTKPYSGEYKPRHVVRAGDIVLANTDLTQAGTVVGSPAIVPDLGVGECIFSHHIYAVRLQAALAPCRPYVYWLLAHDSFKSFAKGHAVGTTVLGMPKEGVTNFRFARPSEDLMRRFSSLASPIHHLAEALHAKNANLRATRDLLLPKLVSGELDVSAVPEPEAVAA